MLSRASKTSTPITNLSSEEDASHLIVEEFRSAGAKRPVGEIEVRSKEQPHMSLGNYRATDPPKGFAIRIDPSPDPEAIVTQITSLGTKEEYELILHIANYGNRTVSAEIWQL